MFFKPFQHVLSMTTMMARLAPREPRVTGVQFTLVNNIFTFWERKPIYS